MKKLHRPHHALGDLPAILRVLHRGGATRSRESPALAPEGRRLDFEALRDSFLFVAGKLDTKMGGKPVDLFKQPFSGRRTIYGIIDRTNFPGTMRTFDVASPDQHAPARYETTVRSSGFPDEQPLRDGTCEGALTRGWKWPRLSRRPRRSRYLQAALGRRPTAAEWNLAVEFIGTEEAKPGFGPWDQLAQVLVLSNEFAFAD